MLRASTRRGFTIPLATAILWIAAAPSFAQSGDTDARRDRPGTFVINRPAYLYAQPSADAKILTKLRPKTVIGVTEVQEQWYKVRSETGKAPGWIRRSYADPFERGGGGGEAGERRRFRVGIFRLTSPTYIYSEASIGAKKLGTLKEGQEVRVVDKNGLWYRIESESGDRPPGYIPTEIAKRVRDVE
jgi:uncharacterized protein YgiM (DUF1202 family)